MYGRCSGRWIFPAEVTQHIPDRGEQQIRCWKEHRVFTVMRSFTSVDVFVISGAIALGLVSLLVGFTLKDRSTKRAEKAFRGLCATTGLSPMEAGASEVRSTLDSIRPYLTVLSAAGRLDGLRVEVFFLPKAHRGRGQTIAATHFPKPLGVRAGLVWHNPIALFFESFSGLPVAVDSQLRFGRYDAFGDPADVRRFFTSGVQAEILAFPRAFENMYIDGPDVVMTWEGVEEDSDTVTRALRLGVALGGDIS
jgi:hypothetical protein